MKNPIIIFLIFILVVFTCSYVIAQDDPFDDEFISIFEESDLYIDANTTHLKSYQEESQIGGGYWGYSLSSYGTQKQLPERETNGVPDPPPPPDVPVNVSLIYLEISGLVLGIVNFFLKKHLNGN